MWTRGSTVVHQETWRGRLWAARPLTVLEDLRQHLLLWMPRGTVRKVPAGTQLDPDAPDARTERIIRELAEGGWAYEDHSWPLSTLVLLRPGDWYGVWTSWLPDGEHLGYYVNLQLPYRRTPLGVEAMDLMLDIVVDPDLTWRWKDEDEFDEIVARGIYGAELERQIRAEAERAIADIEAARWPLDGTFPARLPSDPLPVPVLPAGWDQPC